MTDVDQTSRCDLPGGPPGQVLARLEGVRRAKSGFIARCPAHDDRSPSLAISVGVDGRVLLRCFAGCSALEIVTAMGLRLSDLFERPTNGAWAPNRGFEARALAHAAELRAAANLLDSEVGVVQAAIATGKLVVDQADAERFNLAVERIENVRLILRFLR